jgi:hypothetical protein
MCFLLGFSFFKTFLSHPITHPLCLFSIQVLISWVLLQTTRKLMTHCSYWPLHSEISWCVLQQHFLPTLSWKMFINPGQLWVMLFIPILFWWNYDFYLQPLLFLLHFDAKPSFISNLPINAFFIYLGCTDILFETCGRMGCMIYDWLKWGWISGSSHGKLFLHVLSKMFFFLLEGSLSIFFWSISRENCHGWKALDALISIFA